MEKIEVTKVIKALIVARKGGMPIEDLDKDYQEMEAASIPYLRMGYNSLFEYLREVKEIKYKKNKYGNTVLTVDDEKLNHLNELIKHQKPARTNKKRSKNNRKTTSNKNYDFENNNKNNNSFDYHQQYNNNSDCHQHYNNNFNYQRQYNNNSDCHQQYNNNFEYHRQYNNYSPSVSSGYKSASTSFSETSEKPMINIDYRKRNNYIYEPIFNKRQLIGDDFFLQLAIKELKVPIWRKAEKSALYSGLCVSGQTIRQCIKRLGNITEIADRVTILLGSMDVYQGRTLEQMQADYRELLNILEVDFNLPRTSITICTIPPLANLSFRIDFERSSTLQMFNNWLRNIWRDYYDFDFNGVYWNYNLADFDEVFRNDIGAIKYHYFQNDARYVSGTRQPYVLFNGRGRELALHLLQYS
ncbi:maternal effect protein oskar [Leptopilina boulardi]|uniref:maternal effect protein oskar n=1 Tax=Leptopilina boulardi TaxID=63433 RepID=UPI0021F64A5D|nr:maternal effect protein oskar [Leptopilina boulardi]